MVLLTDLPSSSFTSAEQLVVHENGAGMLDTSA